MTTRLNRGGCIVAAALTFLMSAAPGRLAAQVQPKGSLEGMTAPKPDVPEVFTLQGQYVRVAYNNEGFADPRLPHGPAGAREALGAPDRRPLAARESRQDETIKREDLTLTDSGRKDDPPRDPAGIHGGGRAPQAP